jgi:hypothetical protein
MKQQAMRVVAVDEDGVAQVRRLSWLEWLAYHTSYAVGWLAAWFQGKR